MSKKDMRKQLQAKMVQLDESDVRRISADRLDDLTLSINLNVVCLYFEALIPNATGKSDYQLLCQPAVSTPIQHNSKLKIIEFF
jgi:hypothetical protein